MTEYFPVILDSLTYAGNKNNLSDLDNKSYIFVKGDICDISLVDWLFEKYCFDGVFHFAAESHVDRSIDGPGEFINTNIIGTYNLLEISRKYYKKGKENFKFIHVSQQMKYMVILMMEITLMNLLHINRVLLIQHQKLLPII